MDSRPEWVSNRSERDRAQQELWLLGQPSLKIYLDFVKDMVVGGAEIPRAALADEWRAANDHFYDQAEREGGEADRIGIRELDPVLEPLAAAVRADIRYQRAFDLLPTRFAMVELDRLVVPQPHVNLAHVERLKQRIGSSPSPEALFRFCQPLDRQEAPVKVRQKGSRRFMFWSDSADFRFHEPALLGPNQVTGYDPLGPLGGIVGLMVGFGSNFLNVIQSEDRLLLHNGHHRAYALRELGITHAPCIVQTVTRRDELNLVASSSVCETPVFYFKAPRPPLLKDFFDPALRKVLTVERLLSVVELSFEVKSYEIADFATAV